MNGILIVDDHRLLRETMREILQLEGLPVVGDTGDGTSAVALARQTQPSVVLLDVEMPGHFPVETVRRLRHVAPRSRVIVLTMHDDQQLIRQMLQAGVAAYLHKSVSRANLVGAIRSAAHENEPQVTVTISRPVAVGVSDADGGDSGPLSQRELEVLTLVGQALSNRQIASRLSITEGTVKRHMRNVFRKLGASSRLDAVNRGIAADLIPAARSGRTWRPAAAFS
ncbi:response regulator [Kineosporia succinea]|uniref:DNA-binding NarL/FixJ family response regulator n=1 Tax=Kineosporia succinea TaxID=84632 RepID=A0ABT9P6W4_9ACTN|nr:response regulator transcription factor [Kineosporia succinea]MDP9828426.1 DNA-binding NarL/FixJ family response regulator [Kineosporia succinea]